ncbi:hypothetical protein KY339_02380 [Candidatus Woesearchaeota archaeon]|nr:hypothetical protein [Candidatus Woesearchaeota archaeon]
MATEITLKEGRGDRQNRKVIKIKGPTPIEGQNLVCLLTTVPAEKYPGLTHSGLTPDILIEPARIEPVEEKVQKPRKKVRLYVIPEGSIDALMLSPKEREAIRKRNLERVFGSEETQKADMERDGELRIHNNHFNKELVGIYERHSVDLSPREFIDLFHGICESHKKKLEAILAGAHDIGTNGNSVRTKHSKIKHSIKDERKAAKKYHKRIVMKELEEKAYFKAYGKVVERCFKVIKRILYNEFEAYVNKYNSALAEKAIADGVPERKVKMNGTPHDLEFNVTSLCKNYLGMKRPGVMPDTTFREEVCDILRTGEDSYKRNVVKNDNFKSYVTEMLLKVRTAYADAIGSAKAKLDSLANMGGEHETKVPLSFYLVHTPASA